MSAVDTDELDRIEERLALLPDDVRLPPERAELFARQRARIHQRYNEWRRGMPGLNELFDDDCHRGKALAGSLATEFDRILELRGGPDFAPPDTPDWAQQWAQRWQECAAQMPAAWGWDAAATEMFSTVLGDLTRQAATRAEAGLRPRSERPEVHVSPLRRVGIVLSRLIGRVFRPRPRPR